MASSHDIALPVGIHDGNIVGYRSVCDNLDVEVSLWNGTRLELEFRGVVFVQDFQSCGRPEEVEGTLQQFAEMDGSELLHDVRNRVGREGAARSYV